VPRRPPQCRPQRCAHQAHRHGGRGDKGAGAVGRPRSCSSGQCGTDGIVEGMREIPRLEFPFFVYAVLRWRAKRQPFLCPVCGEPVETPPGLD
jgi:hypothetical protein